MSELEEFDERLGPKCPEMGWEGWELVRCDEGVWQLWSAAKRRQEVLRVQDSRDACLARLKEELGDE